MYAEPKEIKDAIDGIKSDSFDDHETTAVLNLTKIASAFTSRHNKTQDEIMSSFSKLGELMSDYDNAVSECGSAEHLTETQIENFANESRKIVNDLNNAIEVGYAFSERQNETERFGEPLLNTSGKDYEYLQLDRVSEKKTNISQDFDTLKLMYDTMSKIDDTSLGEAVAMLEKPENTLVADTYARPDKLAEEINTAYENMTMSL